MKIEFVDAFERISGEYCSKFPSGYVRCEYNRLCSVCELADRLRKNKQTQTANLALFDWRDARSQTPSGGGENWYNQPVILTPAAMRRLKIEDHLMNQIMIAKDGPGVFKKNVAGEIDGYLLCDKSRYITVARSECFGIPTEKAAILYDEYFFFDLCRILKIDPKKR